MMSLEAERALCVSDIYLNFTKAPPSFVLLNDDLVLFPPGSCNRGYALTVEWHFRRQSHRESFLWVPMSPPLTLLIAQYCGTSIVAHPKIQHATGTCYPDTLMPCIKRETRSGVVWFQYQ
jgi:hypothetical protein